MKGLIFLLLLTGCSTYPAGELISNTAKQAVYATNDSIKVGRFDLAEKYSDTSVALISPPSRRIPIKPIYTADDPRTPEEIWAARMKKAEKSVKDHNPAHDHDN